MFYPSRLILFGRFAKIVNPLSETSTLRTPLPDHNPKKLRRIYRARKEDVVKVSELDDSSLRRTIEYRMVFDWPEIDSVLKPFWKFNVDQTSRTDMVDFVRFLKSKNNGETLEKFLHGRGDMPESITPMEARVLSFVNAKHPFLKAPVVADATAVSQEEDRKTRS